MSEWDESSLFSGSVFVGQDQPKPPSCPIGLRLTRLATSGFDGRWRSTSGSVYFIEGWRCSLGTLTAVGDGKCSLVRGNHEYGGEIAPNGFSITWDDGDIWHRLATTDVGTVLLALNAAGNDDARRKAFDDVLGVDYAVFATRGGIGAIVWALREVSTDYARSGGADALKSVVEHGGEPVRGLILQPEVIPMVIKILEASGSDAARQAACRALRALVVHGKKEACEQLVEQGAVAQILQAMERREGGGTRKAGCHALRALANFSDAGMCRRIFEQGAVAAVLREVEVTKSEDARCAGLYMLRALAEHGDAELRRQMLDEGAVPVLVRVMGIAATDGERRAVLGTVSAFAEHGNAEVRKELIDKDVVAAVVQASKVSESEEVHKAGRGVLTLLEHEGGGGVPAGDGAAQPTLGFAASKLQDYRNILLGAPAQDSNGKPVLTTSAWPWDFCRVGPSCAATQSLCIAAPAREGKATVASRVS